MKQTGKLIMSFKKWGKEIPQETDKKLIPDHLILLRGIIGTYRSSFLREAYWIRPQFVKMLFLDSDLLFYVSGWNEAFRTLSPKDRGLKGSNVRA